MNQTTTGATTTTLVGAAGTVGADDGLAAERRAMARVAGGPHQREAVRARPRKRVAVFTDPQS